MAITSPPPNIPSSDKLSIEELESQIVVLNNRKGYLSESEEKELYRIEGILHSKHLYDKLAVSSQVSKSEQKKYSVIANNIGVKELNEIQMSKISKVVVESNMAPKNDKKQDFNSKEQTLTPKLEHQLFSDGNTEPSEKDLLNLLKPQLTSNSCPPGSSSPIEKPKEYHQSVPNDSEIYHEEMEYSPEFNDSGLPNGDDPLGSAEIDSEFRKNTTQTLLSVAAQRQFKFISIPVMIDDHPSLLSVYDHVLYRIYSSSKYPKECILQLICLKIAPLRGRTIVDSRGMKYFPKVTGDLNEITRLKQNFLATPINTFKEFASMVLSVESKHDSTALHQITAFLKKFLPELIIRTINDVDSVYLRKQRVHFDVTACIVLQNPPPKSQGSPQFFGFPKSQLYFLQQDQIDEFLRYREQKIDLIRAYNNNVITEKVDQKALIQYNQTRKICFSVGICHTIGLLWSIFTGNIPGLIICGLFITLTYGYFGFYSWFFTHNLRNEQSKFLIWNPMQLADKDIGQLK